MHPYHQHKEVHAGRKRAKEMSKSFARGGAAHADEAQDRKLFKKMIKEHEVPGRKSGGRLDKYARGGKTKHGTQVNIAVVAPHGKDHGAAPAPGGPLPATGGGLPMPPPKPMPPAPGPAGMGQGAGMMPPGIMKRGGRAFKRGGKVPMKAGAITGEGRKEKIRAYGLKPHGKN